MTRSSLALLLALAMVLSFASVGAASSNDTELAALPSVDPEQVGLSAEPTEIDAAFLSGGGGRKLCAWPKKAIFVGSDDRSPDAFECR